MDFPGVGMELACGFSQASGQDVLPSLRGEQIRSPGSVAGSLKHFQGLEMFRRDVSSACKQDFKMYH